MPSFIRSQVRSTLTGLKVAEKTRFVTNKQTGPGLMYERCLWDFCRVKMQAECESVEDLHFVALDRA